MNQRRTLLLTSTLLAAGAIGFPLSAIAQAGYPNKSIRFIVPYSAGGLPDTVARIVAQRLGERLGQSVVVDNKPGANGVVAAQALAAVPADGYTFLVTDGSMFSINPAIYKNLSYDFKRDFVPVSLIGRSPLYLAVHPKIGVSSLQEYIALAKAKPGTLTYGSSGVGSTHHLTMEAMKAALGLNIQHIPFKGSGQSVPALIGGQVDSVVTALPSVAGFVKANQARLIASNSPHRSSLAPSVSVIAEIIPGFDFAVVIGLLAPTGTPPAIVDRISAEVEKVVRSSETGQALDTAGVEPVGSKPAEYAKAMQGEIERLSKAIKVAGIKPE